MNALAALLFAAQPSISLVAENCSSHFMELVQAELSASGIGVDPRPGPRPGLVAAVSLRCSESEVVANVDDYLTDKGVWRRIPRVADARADARAAIQVVELLHASLAEARYRPRAALPAPVERLLERQETSLSQARISLLGGAVMAPGGFGVLPSVSATFSDQLGPLEVGASLAGTVRAAIIQSRVGIAEAGLVDARLLVGYPVGLGRARLSPHLGAGALIAWAAGRAQRGLVSTAGVTATFAASVGAWLDVRLVGELSLTAAVDCLVAVVPIRVEVLGEQAARVGLPLLVASLGVSVQ